MLNVFVPEIILHRARVLSVVGKFVSARVPQHMGVQRESNSGALRGPRKHLAKSGRGHRGQPLRVEHVGRWWSFSLDLTKRADLRTSHRVHTRGAALDAADMQMPLVEVDLIPSQPTELGHT